MTYINYKYALPPHRAACDGIDTSYSSNVKLVNAKQNSLEGEYLPNFETIITRGGNATTNLTALGYSETYFNPSLTIFYQPTGHNYSCNDNQVLTDIDSDSQILLSSNDVQNVEASCYKFLNSFIRSHQTPFQSQVFLGESREALELLRHPLKSIEKLTRSFGRSKGALNKDNLKALADLWLEYRFAILPLVSDINEIIKIYNSEVRSVVRDKFYAKDLKTKSESINTQGVLHFYRRDSIFEDKAEYIIHAGLLFEKLDQFTGLADYLQKTLTDTNSLAVSAYELTPWSFLVDYFVNIGDIISASLNTRISANYISGTAIRTITVRRSALDRFVGAGGVLVGGNLSDVPYHSVSKRLVVRRSIASIVPPLTFTLPSTGVKLANITALIISSLK